MRLKKKISALDIVVHAFMIIMVICILYPMLNVVAISFSSSEQIMAGHITIFPRDFTLKNYTYFLGDGKVLRAYANSILYTTVGVLWNVGMTVLMAYPLSRGKLLGRAAITKIIVFTMYFSGGTIPLYLIVKGTGLLDTMWSLIIPQSIWTMEMIIMISFFRSLPTSLYDAAELDGAGEFKTFLNVALPLSKAPIASISLFYFMGHWNSYFTAMLYLGDKNKYPLQMILKSMLLEDSTTVTSNVIATGMTPTGVKNAVIVIAMIPVLLIYPLAQKYFVKGVTVGAIKG